MLLALSIVTNKRLLSSDPYKGVVLIAFSLASATVHAGRPMVTDDAGIVESGACQLETWAQKSRGTTEYWAVPACNFTGNLEMAFGAARINNPDGRQSASVLQAKTLLKPLDSNGWGIGLAVGNRSTPGRSLSGNFYAYIPVSFSFRNDEVLLHTNLGWLHEKEGSRNRMTWAVGSEAQIADRTWMSLESFGQNQGNPFYQFGLRHWVVPDRIQLDATYGNRLGNGSEERWISIGIKFVYGEFASKWLSRGD